MVVMLMAMRVSLLLREEGALHAEVEVLSARLQKQMTRGEEKDRELSDVRADVSRLKSELALREEQLEATRTEVRFAAVASGEAGSRARAEIDLVSRELHTLDRLTSQASVVIQPGEVEGGGLGEETLHAIEVLACYRLPISCVNGEWHAQSSHIRIGMPTNKARTGAQPILTITSRHKR